jgi:AcrR family transcriptional regulator
MTKRREELLDALVGYVLQHGLAELSLRPMAAAVGTSARLLIFHFGTKEALLEELLGEVEGRLQRSLTAPRTSREAALGPLLAVWSRALEPEPFACLVLLYELQLRASREPRRFKPHLRSASGRWRRQIAASLPPGRRSAAMATLFGAVFDGLLLETATTGDRRRTSAAVREFTAIVVKAWSSGTADDAPPARPRRERA